MVMCALQGSVSYHPRLILFDMCGSLGGLNAAGEVGTGQQAADVAAAAATWDGGVVTCESERVEASWFVSSLAEEEEGSYGQDEERDGEADMDQHGDYSDGEGGAGGGGRASRQARGGGIQARAGLDAAAHKSAAADEEVSPVEVGGPEPNAGNPLPLRHLVRLPAAAADAPPPLCGRRRPRRWTRLGACATGRTTSRRCCTRAAWAS